MKPLHIVILAAGEGKRMKSARAKVMLPLAGRPMLAHVLDTARALQPERIHVVHGHRGAQLQSVFAGQADLDWVHQAEQRGTGHAMHLAIAGVPDAARVLVLYGDVPLIQPRSLQPLLATAELAVLTRGTGEPVRLWPHRSRCRGTRRGDRRGKGLRHAAARDHDGQHRHSRRPRGCD